MFRIVILIGKRILLAYNTLSTLMPTCTNIAVRENATEERTLVMKVFSSDVNDDK
jgi:hypothetical protein